MDTSLNSVFNQHLAIMSGAVYADLPSGTNDRFDVASHISSRLRDDLSASEIGLLVNNYRVVDSIVDPSGVSAVWWKNGAGKSFLAIDGLDAPIGHGFFQGVKEGIRDIKAVSVGNHKYLGIASNPQQDALQRFFERVTADGSKVTLVGHSLGYNNALELLLNNPNLVEQVIGFNGVNLGDVRIENGELVQYVDPSRVTHLDASFDDPLREVLGPAPQNVLNFRLKGDGLLGKFSGQGDGGEIGTVVEYELPPGVKGDLFGVTEHSITTMILRSKVPGKGVIIFDSRGRRAQISDDLIQLVSTDPLSELFIFSGKDGIQYGSNSEVEAGINFSDEALLGLPDGILDDAEDSLLDLSVEILKDGSVVVPGGVIIYPGDIALLPNGNLILADGTEILPGDLSGLPDGDLDASDDLTPEQIAGIRDTASRRSEGGFFGRAQLSDADKAEAIGGRLGGLLATELYQAFGGDNVAIQLVVGALGTTLGQAAGVAFSNDFENFGDFNFGENFGSNLAGAAAGFAGGYLGGELAEAIFGDSELAISLGSALGSAVATSALTAAASNQAFGQAFSSNFSSSAGGAIGGVIGTFAGSLVSTKLFGLDSPNAVKGGQIGAAVGAVVGQVLLAFAPIIGAMIGAFIGSILGSAIGSLFGGPQTPLAQTTVEFRHDVGAYVITDSGDSDGGNAAATLQLAAAARDALNGLTELIGGQVVTPGIAGHYGEKYFFSTGGNEFLSNQFDTAQAAIGNGVARQIRAAQIEGGDLYMKRALANSTALTREDLIDDLQTASEYGLYLDNQALYDDVVEIGDADQLAAFEAMLARATDDNGLDLDTASASDNYKRADAPDAAAVLRPIADIFHDILDSDGSAAAFAAVEAHTGLVVLDLADDGLELVAAADSEARFDIDNDGFLERTGWVGPTDGFLVMDRNRDGRINDVSEMFSTISRFNQGESEIQALGSLDTFRLGGNGDNILDANDAGWEDLRIWIDRNQDGLTDLGEVQALHRVGIEAISLISEEAGGYQAGNLVDTRSQVLQFGRDDAAVELPEVGENFFTAAYSVSFGHETLGVGDAVEGGAGFNGIEFEGGNGIRIVEGLEGVALDADPEVASFIVGGEGDDTLSVADGAEGGAMLNGGAGNDVLTGGTDDDILVGGEGVDTFIGGAGDDIFVVDDEDLDEHGRLIDFDPGDGFDLLVHEGDTGLTLTASDGVEAFVGGAGNDSFSVSGEVGVVFSGAGGDDVGFGANGDDKLDGVAGDDKLSGGAGDDIIIGGDGADELRGGAGEDTLSIDADDTVIEGGDGADTAIVTGVEGVTLDLGAAAIETVIGGVGDDYFTAGGTVSVELSGGQGNDTLAGGSAGDTLDGGLGADTVDYSASAAAVSINLQDSVFSGGDATDDVLTSIENVIGSDHVDTLRGDFRSNVLEGGGGGDLINGDVGSDTASYAGSPADGTTTNGVTINLATGTVSGADAAGDTLVGIENLRGSAHDDSLTGDAGANTLDGGFGDDVLTGNGNAGDTYIFGHGYGDDTVVHSGIGGTVRFAEDVQASHVTFQQSGNDLLITLLLSDGETVVSDNTLTVQDWYLTAATDRTAFALADGTAVAVAETVFADGTLTTLNATAAGQQLVGTDGLGETLLGAAGNDVLVGGGGGDHLNGSGGDDTYVFGSGDGLQTIHDHNLFDLVQPWQIWIDTSHWESDDTGDYWVESGYYSASTHTSTALGEGGTDVLEFGPSINATNIKVNVSGNSLVIGLTDPDNPVAFSALTDKVTLTDWFLPSLVDAQIYQTWVDTSSWQPDSTNEGQDMWVVSGHYGSSYSNVTIDTPNRIETFRFIDGGVTELAVPDILNLIGSDEVEAFTWAESALELELELGAGDDVVTAGDYVDFLAGEAGNDTLDGAGGNNVLDGGDGNDVLTAGDGVDLLTGGDGNDVLDSGAEGDLLDGGAGDDTLTAGDGTDVLIGGTGNDTFDGGDGRDTANYAEAAGRVVGTLSTGSGTLETAGTITVLDADTSTLLETDTVKGIESFIGSIHDDDVTGNAEDNRLDGGEGDDTLSGGAGIDLLRGDGGDDDLSGDAGNDHLVGGLGDDTVDGGADNDRLRGNDGNDTIIGGAGADMLFGNDGDDVLEDIGDADVDELDGGKGDDILKGDTGDIYRFDARAGHDTIDHTGGAARVIFGAGIYLENITFHKAGDLDSQDANPNDLIVKVNTDVKDELRVVGWFGLTPPNLSFEMADGTSVTVAPQIVEIGIITGTVTGTAGADMLVGGSLVDTLLGNGGNDTLVGGTGNDVLQGGAGDDLYRFDAGFGSDTLTDSTGTTTVEFGAGILSGDIEFEEVSGDLVVTTSGIPAGGTATVADTLTVENWNALTTNFFMVDGEPVSVALSDLGTASGETLTGTAGMDRLVGLDGADTLIGGDSTDILVGGAGDDTLIGGSDTVTSGSGVDIYQYEIGDGFDDIFDAGGAGRVVFGDGIAQDDLAFEREAVDSGGTLNITEHLIVEVKGVQALRINNWFASVRENRVSFRLSDGAPVHMTILHQGSANGETIIGDSFTDHIIGGAGDDTLLAGAGDDTIDGGDGEDVIEGTGRSDTLIGGAGADYLNGGRGNDLYLYESGDGADTVYDDYSYVTVTTSVALTPEHVVTDYYNSDGDIESSKTVTHTSDWIEYVEDPNSGDVDNPNFIQVHHILDRVTTTVTQTVHLEGGAGDVLRFGAGINSANLTIKVDGNDIVVGVDGDPENPTTFGSLTDTITIKDWLLFDDGIAKHRIEKFQFDDGSFLDIAGIAGRFGTDGADTIAWTESALAISAGAGDDVITGSEFEDAISGDAGVDTLTGGDGDDSLDGGDGVDTLLGGLGSDVLEGGAGGDLLDGGEGSNVASYKNSAEAVTIALTAAPTLTLGTSAGGDAVGDTLVGIGNLAGSAYDDFLTGNDDVNVLLGDAGNDVLAGGLGGDFLFGGLGADTASYVASAAAVEVNLTTGIAVGGDAEGDVLGDIENIDGSAQADILVGDTENNSLAGNAGDDLLYGLTGNDTLEGGVGADTLNGGAGVDTVSYAGSSAGVTVDLSAAGTMSGGDAAGDTLSNFENIVGSSHADTLTGDAGNNVLIGGAGGDLLNGGSDGNDTVSYESALQGITADLVSGGLGDDAAGDSYTNIDNVIGSGFDDTLAGDGAANTLEGGAGDDTLDGRGGVDTASFESGFAGVSADLAATTVTAVMSDGTLTETDTLSNFENLSGSAFGDTLLGDGNVNVLFGSGGDDTLDGVGGADTLDGGSGQDTLIAGAGDDVLDGGSGFDRAVFDASGGAVTISVSVEGDVSATNTLTGTDTLIDIERVDASDSADDLDLSGHGAAIDLYGFAGNDTLTGGDGSDLLVGGDGDDTLTGGDGFDRLIGGKGSDLFIVDADDTVVGEGSNLVVYSEEFGDSSWSKYESSVTADAAIAPDGSETADLLTPDASGNADLSLLPSLTETGTYQWSIYLKSADGGTVSTQLLVADNTSGWTVLTSESIDITGEWQRFSVSADIVNTGQHYFRLGSENTLTEGENVYVWGAQIEAGNALGDYVKTEGAAILPDAGVDRIESAESFALPNRVDILALTGSADVSATGNADVNTLTGNTGANVLSGLGGGDTLLGGDGDDTLAGGTGADWLDGGVGLDVASFAEASAGVTVDLSAGSTITVAVPNGTLSETDTLIGVEGVSGSGFDDVLTGDSGNNILYGAAGHDSLLGGVGDDTLSGGDGSDVLTGGAGADTAVFTGSAADYTAVWSGSTVTVTALTGGGGADTLTGIETLQFDDHGMAISATNAGPVAVSDSAATNKETAISGDVLSGAGADIDIDGGTLTVTEVEGAAGNLGNQITLTSGALLTLNGNGTFDYDPNGQFDTLGNGETDTDTFTYTISDGQGGTSSATVTVTVGSVNFAPEAVDDVIAGTEDTIGTITAASLLGNDTDMNNDTLTLTTVQNAVNGTATLDVNGDVVFTPSANFNGAATFEYTAGDGNGAVSSATVTVNVAAVNDAPVASDQSITLSPNSTGVGTLSATDVDSGQAQSYSISSGPSDGFVDMGTDGVFSYRPELGFYGTDSFTAQVDDLNGGTDTATVSVTVSNPAGLIAGTSSNETVSGNSSANALYGFAGTDTLIGSGGADELYGGTGADRLEGGQHNDTYGFLRGDGLDTIHDDYTPMVANQVVVVPGYTDDENNYVPPVLGPGPVSQDGGSDIISFGSDIAVSDVALELSGSTLKVGIVDSSSPDTAFGSLSDRVTIENWTNTNDKVETLEFFDGTTIAISSLSTTQNALGNTTGVTQTGGSGMDWLAGGSGGDTLTGNAGGDVLVGLGGADLISGGAGADVLSGGDGADTATYLASGAGVTVDLEAGTGVGGDAQGDTLIGIENINGSNFADTLTGDDGINTLFGYDGNDNLQGLAGADALYGNGGDDVVNGGAGDDLVDGSAGNDTVYGGAGNDVLYGVDGTDTLYGEDGNDQLVAGSGNDVVYGGAGDDNFRGDLGNDALDGGAGTDLADYFYATGAVNIDLAGGTMTGTDGNDTLVSIENAYGSNTGDDTIVGNSGANVLNGFAGNDVVDGGAGSDVLTGGDGTDTASFASATDGVHADLAAGTASGGSGDDTLLAFENLRGGAFGDVLIGDGAGNVIEGFGGNDTLVGGAGNDTLDGGGGIDSVDFYDVSGAVTVDLDNGSGNGVASGDGSDTLTSIENVFGSNVGADTITGDSGANTLFGHGGNDAISGEDGADFLDGGAGADSLAGGDGADTLQGGSGFDTLDGGIGDDILDAGLDGGLLNGGDGNDQLAGQSGADTLNGGGEDDILEGRGGNDALDGGAGVDTAVFSGDLADYGFSWSGSTLTVTDQVGTNGTDTVMGVELLSFADQSVVVDNDNLLPIARPDAEFTNQDTIISGDVLGGAGADSDLDGGTLTISGVNNETADVGTQTTLASGALLTLNADGTFDYDPNGQFDGLASNETDTDSFTYAVSDGQGGASAGTVTVTIDGLNDAPTVVADSAVTQKGAAVTILASSLLSNDSDVDGDTPFLVAVQNAADGTATLDVNGDVLFTPDPTFSGVATFDYVVSDGKGGTSNATVNVTVNNAPVAVSDSVSATEDTPKTILASTLLSNDTDIDNDSLTLTAVQNAVNGTATLDVNGDVVFTPGANFNGAATFEYTAGDGNGGTSNGTVTVNVAAVNDAPVAVSDSVSATEDTAKTILASTLLSNDTDIENDSLTLTAVQNAVNGTATLDVNGDVVFTPGANFNGAATFEYTAGDGNGGTSNGTVTVNVAAVNDAPVAVSDSVSATEDTAKTILASTLLSNDTDIENDTLTITTVQNAVNGTATLDVNGDVVFTPSANFNGAATFEYTAGDGNGGTSNGTVTVNVAAVNDAPVVVSDSVSATEDTAKTILASTLLSNDTDIENDSLTLTAVQNAVNGTATLDVNGDVVFTPSANFNGAATFEYTAGDGNGGTSNGTVTVNVAAVNDAPVASDQSITLSPNSTGVGTLSATDVDSGQAQSYSITAGPSDGFVDMGTDGVFSYRPELGFYGTDSFTAQVDDLNGGTDTATVSVTVSNPAGLIAGTSSNETVSGNSSANALYGFAGTDTLIGSGGADELYGGTGTDRLEGGDGNDTYGFLRGDGLDTIRDEYQAVVPTWVVSGYHDGENWVDTSHMTYPTVEYNAGSDILSFGSDIAVSDVALDLSGSTLKVGIVDSASPDTAFASLSDRVTIENWTDTKDKIETLKFFDGTTIAISSLSTTQNALGNTTGVTQTGGSGIDWLAGGSGGDTLTGNAGGDVLVGLGGADTLNGSAGNDILGGGDGADYLDGGADADTLHGGDGDDDLYGSGGADVVNGDAGADYLHGGAGFDTLRGGDGNDTLDAGTEGAILNGDGGNDWLVGQEGADTLDGGAGNDILNGGTGSDTYMFGRGDGVDTLDNTGSDGSSTDTLTFDAGIASDQLWLTQSGNNLEISIVGLSDTVSLTNWFTDTAKRVDRIEVADETGVLEANEVQSLVNAMAGFTAPTGSDPDLPSGIANDTDFQNALQAAWDA